MAAALAVASSSMLLEALGDSAFANEPTQASEILKMGEFAAASPLKVSVEVESVAAESTATELLAATTANPIASRA